MNIDNILVDSSDFNSYFIKNKMSVRNNFISACNIIMLYKNTWDSCVIVPNYRPVTKKTAEYLLLCFMDSKTLMRIPNINDSYIFVGRIPYTSDFVIKFINTKTGDYCDFLFSENCLEFKAYPSFKEFIDSI